MIDVRFYEYESDVPLKFAVIYAETGGRTVWCRHRERSTWEFPGGHIEPGETAVDAAERELREETGATRFDLKPVCVYSVEKDGVETFGALFVAEIFAFGPLENEIAELAISHDPPGEWTYPEIQPHLMEKVMEKSRPAPKKKRRALKLLALVMVPVLLFAGAFAGYSFGKKRPWIWNNPVVRHIRVWNWHGNLDYAAAQARLRFRNPEAANADRIDSYKDKQGVWFFCWEETGQMEAYFTGSLWYVNRKGAHLLYRGDDILALSVHYFKDEHIFCFRTGKGAEDRDFIFIAGPDGPVQPELPDSFVGITGFVLERCPQALLEPNPSDSCHLVVRDGRLCELAAVEMTLGQFKVLPGAQELLDALAAGQPTAEVTDLLWRDNGSITLNLQYDDGQFGHVSAWIEECELHYYTGWASEIVVDEGRATAARNVEEFPVVESGPWIEDKLYRY